MHILTNVYSQICISEKFCDSDTNFNKYNRYKNVYSQ